MCVTVVRANFCCERASERALPRHTGSFEISCRLPIGKVLFLHPIAAGPPEGSRTSPSLAARGARAPGGATQGSQAVNHGRPPAPRRVTLAAPES